MTTGKSPIRVLIVDDSSLIRQLLTMLLSADPQIEVVGAAPDPFVARDKIKALNPDVVTLDVEMPRMDGLSFLQKIMELHPLPVVMISSLTQANADVTIKALEYGAVDFVAKPTKNVTDSMEALGAELRDKIKSAARVKVRARKPKAPRPVTPIVSKKPGVGSTSKVVFVGASTGGVEALMELLLGFPADCPPILITQHMPPKFTLSFANRLNGECAMTVVEAANNLPVQPGHVYIAPGALHLEIQRAGPRLACRVHDKDPVSGHRPSVNVLFRSAAQVIGRSAIGVILTGMGKDGAEGLLEMRQAGAMTFGQDEDTSLIYGMPKVAFEIGAVARQLPLTRIAGAVLDACKEPKVKTYA